MASRRSTPKGRRRVMYIPVDGGRRIRVVRDNDGVTRLYERRSSRRDPARTVWRQILALDLIEAYVFRDGFVSICRELGMGTPPSSLADLAEFHERNVREGDPRGLQIAWTLRALELACRTDDIEALQEMGRTAAAYLRAREPASLLGAASSQLRGHNRPTDGKERYLAEVAELVTAFQPALRNGDPRIVFHSLAAQLAHIVLHYFPDDLSDEKWSRVDEAAGASAEDRSTTALGRELLGVNELTAEVVARAALRAFTNMSAKQVANMIPSFPRK